MTTNPQSPDELVERVARAISEAGYSIGPLESEHCARAAIAAMPELTALQQRVKQLEEGLERAAENFERMQVPHLVGNDVYNFAYQAAKLARSLLSDAEVKGRSWDCKSRPRTDKNPTDDKLLFREESRMTPSDELVERDTMIAFALDGADELEKLGRQAESMLSAIPAIVAEARLEQHNAVYEGEARRYFRMAKAIRAALSVIPLEGWMPSEAQIKRMTERFLSWKLPEHFNPDNGISYTRPNYHPSVNWEAHRPVGTNLLTYDQAEEMVRHMVERITPEWCVNMAELERGHEVGAGFETIPTPPQKD